MGIVKIYYYYYINTSQSKLHSIISYAELVINTNTVTHELDVGQSPL